jgi:hypothetical protein
MDPRERHRHIDDAAILADILVLDLLVVTRGRSSPDLAARRVM